MDRISNIRFKIGKFKDILMFIESLFANPTNKHKLKIKNTYTLENRSCPIKKTGPKIMTNFNFLLDSSLIDYWDTLNWLLGDLLGRYSIHNRDNGIP